MKFSLMSNNILHEDLNAVIECQKKDHLSLINSLNLTSN